MMNSSECFSMAIYGRGGQGAKTASTLFAEVAIALEKNAQAFPEYGPERTGAPVKAYVRLSDNKILTHQPVLNPDAVLVIDDSLLDIIPITKNLKNDAIIVLNTNKSESVIKKKLSLNKNFKGKIAIVDASKIAIDKIGANKSNTPTLAGLLKVKELINFNDFIQVARTELTKKLGKSNAEKNISAMKSAYKEVKLI